MQKMKAQVLQQFAERNRKTAHNFHYVDALKPGHFFTAFHTWRV
jgi:hypothetical protein